MTRVTMVCGAETAAGRAVIDRLGADGHVILACVEDDYQVSELEAEFDPDELIATVLDLTDGESLSDALDLAVDSFGPPTGLVVVAPVRAWPSLVEDGLEALTAAVEQRILGPVAAVALAAERMDEGGSVVLVLPSPAVPTGPAVSGLVSGAIDGFVAAAASELARRSIRINAVHGAGAEATVLHLLSAEAERLTGQVVRLAAG